MLLFLRLDFPRTVRKVDQGRSSFRTFVMFIGFSSRAVLSASHTRGGIHVLQYCLATDEDL